MAENVYLDLVVDTALERYNLDADEWGMTSFSEGAKSFSVGLENSETGAKVKAIFSRIDIRMEEMKLWSAERKKQYLKYLDEVGEELPEDLVDSFHEVMLKLDLPSEVAEGDEDDTILVEDGITSEEAAELTGESVDELEDKLAAKKVKKSFKRKVV